MCLWRVGRDSIVTWYRLDSLGIESCPDRLWGPPSSSTEVKERVELPTSVPLWPIIG